MVITTITIKRPQTTRRPKESNMDSIDTLIALSPLDGRYAPKLEAMPPAFPKPVL